MNTSFVRVETSGGQELARRLATLPDAVHAQVVGQALRKAGEPIRARAAATMARSAVPHAAREFKSGRGGVRGRHGQMGASHVADHVVVQLGRTRHSLAVGPAEDWWYWLFQEFGTVRVPAQPALRPAFDAHGQESLAILQRELWAAIRAQAEGDRTRMAPQTRATETFL